MIGGLTRSAAPLLAALLVASCGGGREQAAERPSTVEQRFTSREAVLLDFELDGRLLVDAASVADPRPAIEAQLLYMVGQLGGDRSGGRYERLVLSNVVITPAPSADLYAVTYHATLPVAWGASAIPTTYVVTVPARVGEEDQASFVDRYGESCVDPAEGKADAWNMFLLYRPQRPGCVFASDDVVTFTATVKPAAEHVAGTYPEYDRVWEDGALRAVVMFSRAEPELIEGDEGVRAYEAFTRDALAYLRALQPDDARGVTAVGTTGIHPEATLGASLPDGRSVTIDAKVVGYRLQDDDASFDSWYDARTPAADLIVYGGHAGLGENVRALQRKGSFRSGQYVVYAVNGCNTFAYVDRSLSDRRARLNPGDPTGTKYMDTVTNVMAGYFVTTPEMPMAFIEAMLTAGDPARADDIGAFKTYQDIFADIDPEQIVVVTGEHDNEFVPAPLKPSSVLLVPPPPEVIPTIEARAAADTPLDPEGAAGCSAAGGAARKNGAVMLLALLCLGARRRRGSVTTLRPRAHPPSAPASGRGPSLQTLPAQWASKIGSRGAHGVSPHSQ